MKVWKIVSYAISLYGLTIPAAAHEKWANDKVVPDWVKSYCCGPEDVHHLKPEQVHARPDGWHVDGYRDVIPYGTELDSQDGDYWAFYRTYQDGSQSRVFCFFAPPRSF
jgi:hypothetical protein